MTFSWAAVSDAEVRCPRYVAVRPGAVKEPRIPGEGGSTSGELKMAVIPRRPHISRGIHTKLPRLVIAYR